MNLPQELLDEIFSHLPPHDEESLRACSLVAKRWVYPTQRLLFSSVVIDPNTYQSWKDSISPTNAELLSHVRSFYYFTWAPPPPHWSFPPIDALLDYLPSFCQLQDLTLCDVRIKSDFSEQVKIFSAFQYTLSSLSLHEISLPWIAFVTLVDFFPYLRNLEIRDPSYVEDDRQSIPLSRPLRGGLSIDMFTEEALGTFSSRLSGMEVAYNELTIYEIPTRLTPHCYQHIIDTCGESLKRLNFHSPGVPPALSYCSELRQLELYTIFPGKAERAVISSITSTDIRTIVFTSHPLHVTLCILLDDPCMPLLDDTMRGLVDKLCVLGYEHTLELEFRIHSVIFDYDLDYRKYFPKFGEKGRVRVLNTSNGKTLKVIHLSELVGAVYLLLSPSPSYGGRKY
ncbi:hypothetical protein BDM02DRAFT_3271888 [Thelephora ganbajun]|uniref:Uncharacterized protein n=1 Tax=Thelephora ganbajun TaxID=370292 RepID=A0ACB6Z635_THEGA|nr:hypothetical protein BDM02DRAFT_3271888 [Thelephora ganbajun]